MERTEGDFVEVINVFKKVVVEKEENVTFLNQLENEANHKVHRETTGPEIWEDTDGQDDILVATVGTVGTLSGAGAYLKSKNPNIKVVGVEPGIASIATLIIPMSLKLQVSTDSRMWEKNESQQMLIER